MELSEHSTTVKPQDDSTLPRLECISIVVPVFREKDNIEPLIVRIHDTISQSQYSAEVIFVDDNSQDGTIDACDAASAKYKSEKFNVKLITRTDERGLSSAVLRGMRESSGNIVIVMDGDLQHPPEKIPEVVSSFADQIDFVTGTRYAKSGGVSESWPLSRKIASWLATVVAKPLTPVSDPMSGFFAIKRDKADSLFSNDNINPTGFKIALEIYVKTGCKYPAEVPIDFDARKFGESKLSGFVIWQYFIQLIHLYLFKMTGKKAK